MDDVETFGLGFTLEDVDACVVFERTWVCRWCGKRVVRGLSRWLPAPELGASAATPPTTFTLRVPHSDAEPTDWF